MLALSAFFLAVTLLSASMAHLMTGLQMTVEPDTTVPPAMVETLLPEKNAEEADSLGEDVKNMESPGDSQWADGDIANMSDRPESELFNRPGQMRGVYLTPGTDFIFSRDAASATVKAEVDKAIADAKKLTMNAVIIDTVYIDTVIYQTKDSPMLSEAFDIMDYIVTKARENNLYIYAIFDTSFYQSKSSGAALLSTQAASADTLSLNLREFTEKYRVDGVLLDGYLNAQTPQSYSLYAMMGSAIGYNNFMRQSPQAVIRNASDTLRRHAPGVQVGLLADAVWENASENENGSATKASFTALGNGNADTRSFLTSGLVDFVAVKAYGSTTDSAAPFGEVVRWWAGVAGEAGVPMYAVHASAKICTEAAGWQSQDQLVRQLIEADGISGFGGSVFNSLKRLNEDPKSATTTMIRYFNQEVNTEHILTELAVTKPEKTSYTTNEQIVTFTGASDPNFPVTINGEAIPTDASGYFTITRDLKGGENSFKISHKEKNITYTIVREIEILKEITPQGSIAAEGNMSINITALAYADAKVYATIGGATVQMAVQEDDVVAEAQRDSSYRLFAGQYTTPAATSSEQNLGNITVHAQWQDQEKSIQGAAVRVNKKAKIEDGVPVVIVADQAETYPYNTLDNVPSPLYYPLPAGAMDYAVGDEIVYKKGNETYTYFVLASRLRVRAEDIATSKDYVSANVINGLDIRSENGYTYLTVKTAQKVSYSFGYAAGGVTITFHNTDKVSGNTALADNAIFQSAQWTDNGILSLSFIKNGGFMGYKAYYEDNGDLTFRFNNPPSSLAGARIAIDPGHGGKDVGALGFLANYPERTINVAIAQLVAAELKSRGATVLLLDTSNGMELKERVRQAERFEADMFVSIHNNTAPNANATGTEVYYFYPFSRTLAANASASVSSGLATNNRGAKQSYYHVTLSSQMASVLVECGFLSNKGEYEKLIKTKNQERIAVGIADAVAASIKAAATGYKESATTTATQPAATQPTTTQPAAEKPPADVSTTPAPTSPTTPADDAPPQQVGGSDSSEPVPPGGEPATTTPSGTAAVTKVELYYDEISMETGEMMNFSYDIYPENAANQRVTWKSSNPSVASVSSSGAIQALAAGTANITITTQDGGFTASCLIEVTGSTVRGMSAAAIQSDINEPGGGSGNQAVQDLSFAEDISTLARGSSYQLRLLTHPANISDLQIDWWTSDDSIIRVDSRGNLTGVSAGTCTIVAALRGTSLEVSCRITVQ